MRAIAWSSVSHSVSSTRQKLCHDAGRVFDQTSPASKMYFSVLKSCPPRTSPSSLFHRLLLTPTGLTSPHARKCTLVLHPAIWPCPLHVTTYDVKVRSTSYSFFLVCIEEGSRQGCMVSSRGWSGGERAAWGRGFIAMCWHAADDSCLGGCKEREELQVDRSAVCCEMLRKESVLSEDENDVPIPPKTHPKGCLNWPDCTKHVSSAEEGIHH